LQGIQVIAPDLLGYGKTSAPADIATYTLKCMSAHLAQIIRAETDLPVILGGHDWGSYLTWRLALYSPELVKGIFSFTVPYFPPTPVIVTLEEFNLSRQILPSSTSYSWQVPSQRRLLTGRRRISGAFCGVRSAVSRLRDCPALILQLV
jgi:pimeloyl-ACP methyl ester carboxylesterase